MFDTKYKQTKVILKTQTVESLFLFKGLQLLLYT